MFKQRMKNKRRLTKWCEHPKHLFPKNKGKCKCGNYYKYNGIITRKKGDHYVAGTTADFHHRRNIKGKRKK